MSFYCKRFEKLVPPVVFFFVWLRCFWFPSLSGYGDEGSLFLSINVKNAFDAKFLLFLHF